MNTLRVIEPLLERTVGGLGFELAGWEGSGHGGLLQVFIDKPGGVTVDDCALVSNQLSRVLEVEGVDYVRLEISSPGLDRLLRNERDFLRFTGKKARIKLRQPREGQRNFLGVLRAVHDGTLEVEVDGVLLAFQLSNLERARLVPDI